MAEGGKTADEYDTFTCLICGQNGFTEPQMRDHVLSDHVEQQEVYCPFCDLSGITANEMNLHINTAHLEDCFSPDGATSGTESDFPECSAMNCSDSDSPNDKETTMVTDGATGSIPDLVECSTESVDSCSSVETFGKKKSRLCLNVPSVSGIVQSSVNNRNAISSSVSSSSGALQNEPEPGPSTSNHQQAENNQQLIIPDINDNVEPDINSNIPTEFTCPLCRYCTNSEGQIQSHVNSEHVDVLSPENGFINGNGDHRYMCPICTMSFYTAQELQIHVNAKHMDILSPDKSSRWSNGQLNGDSEDIHICPMCDEEFHEPALLEIHVNGHFSAEQTPGMVIQLTFLTGF